MMGGENGRKEEKRWWEFVIHVALGLPKLPAVVSKAYVEAYENNVVFLCNSASCAVMRIGQHNRNRSIIVHCCCL